MKFELFNDNVNIYDKGVKKIRLRESKYVR